MGKKTGNQPIKPDAFTDATTAFQGGNFDGALQVLRRVLESDPDHLEALILSGRVHMQQGNLDEAAGMFENALVSNAENPGCLNALGVILFMQGRANESEEKLQQATKHAPNYLEAIGNLGLVKQHLGKSDEALVLLQTAVKRGGATAKTLQALGAELIEQSQPERARKVLSRLTESQPDNAVALTLLGKATGDCGDHEQAGILWQRALAIDASIVEPDACRARLWQSTGDIPNAIAAMERVLTLDFAHAATLFSWAFVADGNAHAELSRGQVKSMAEAALTAQSVSHIDRCRLGFAAGKLSESDKEYAHAATHYREANQQVWSRNPVSTDMYQSWHDRLLALFTTEFFEQHKDTIEREPTKQDRCGEGLIFIVGMPRSGTTLVEQIIARDDGTLAGGERSEMDMMCNVFVEKLADVQAKGKGTPIPMVFVRDLAGKHHAHVAGMTGKHVHFTDKSPRNFMNLGMIACLFPKAKIIHCVRDPIDTCVSCYFNYFGHNAVKYSYDQEMLGLFYTLYRQMMKAWQQRLPVSVRDVIYEDVVGNPDDAIKTLTDYCGFNWDEKFLHPEEGKRVANTASLAQVKKPIYTGSVGRWTPYEAHLQPLLNALAAADVS